MDAYDYCKHVVETWPNRWTGSVGELESGDWMESELARMGYGTRQVRFDVGKGSAPGDASSFWRGKDDPWKRVWCFVPY